MTSQKEFIVGCLIGGIVGASAALLLPKRVLNGFSHIQLRQNKSNGHKNHTTHALAAHHQTAKKASAKRSVKHK